MSNTESKSSSPKNSMEASGKTWREQKGARSEKQCLSWHLKEEVGQQNVGIRVQAHGAALVIVGEEHQTLKKLITNEI